MRRRIGSVIGALLAFGVSVNGPTARAGHEPEDPPPSERLPGDLDCFGVSQDASAAMLTDSGDEVVLSVLVLVDRTGPELARTLMSRASEAYKRIGLVLDLTYRPVTLSGTDSWTLLNDARAHLAATHVTGFELVHVLTGVNLTAQGDTGVAGHALCIGGIRHAKYHLAVSISEATYPEGRVFNGVTLSKDGPALAAAHEIGHVLGAHHAHGNCAENAEHALPAGEAAVCTVMDSTAFLSQLTFGRVEQRVIRGYALHYGSG